MSIENLKSMVQQGDDVCGNPSQEDADVNSNPRVFQLVADVSSKPSQEGDDFFSKPRVQNGADVSSNPIQEGDNVFSNPRVQEVPLQRLQETTMSNVCSLTQKEVSLSNKRSLSPLRNEIAILKRLDHENIIQYYGTDKDEEMLYMFLELVSNGTLEQAYKNCPFKESQVSHYTRQILQGLKYLHGCNVIHRDLKCANIMVTEFGNIKLADFGLSKCMEDGQSLKPGLGSSFWLAPEVANPKSGGYDFRADTWSLGCAVVEMSTGKYPQYHFRDALALERAIRKGTGPIIPNSLSHTLKDFINKCLQPDPNKRPTAADITGGRENITISTV
ncbi:hypothetical protein H0E87_028653 [Populus deltoides]|uniref:Protein kinase domain-containing protein n=1 Tax=Populus deltoides TaxID=3696 RepID=A0A8T2WVX3_POPDE|nr:hypothetical protein H0E87_028653 [Populus deltoides]